MTINHRHEVAKIAKAAPHPTRARGGDLEHVDNVPFTFRVVGPNGLVLQHVCHDVHLHGFVPNYRIKAGILKHLFWDGVRMCSEFSDSLEESPHVLTKLIIHKYDAICLCVVPAPVIEP